MGFLARHHKVRILKELARKSFHILAGLFIVFGYSYVADNYSKMVGLLCIYVLLLAYIIFEHIRLEYSTGITAIIGVLLRRKEKNNVTASINFLIGSLILFSMFDFKIGFTAMLMLVFGDMSAAVFGLLFGEKKLWRNRTYVGTLAGFAANLIVGFVVLGDYPVIYIPMAVTATLAELFTTKLDDNLTMSLFGGFAGYFAAFLFNISL